MLASVTSATLLGVEGRPVAVEVHVAAGLPGFTIVGLPDAACRESRDRVRAALGAIGIAWPNRKVIVNLAPSGIRKGGAGLDLPIAVALLIATGHLPAEPLCGWAFLGELGLDGSLRRVPGVLPLVAAMDCTVVVVPPDCAWEAGLVEGREVRCPPTLAALVEAARGEREWPDPPDPPKPVPPGRSPDLADVKGHAVARLALEVAAVGGHHLLLVGPPGSGKTMLAQRLPGLLPPLDGAMAREATTVRSAAGLALPPGGLVTEPPLRAPHHTASMVSVIGGGTTALRPGEVSLSHGGVLFLDEMGEFPRDVLDALRQPLEEGVVRVCRARAAATFPARFLLAGAMNPCPCGEGGPVGWCRCGNAERSRYARRLSGPLFDRFDLRLTVSRPDPAQLLASSAGEPTAAVAARVAEARAPARARGVRANAELSGSALDAMAPLSRPAAALLHGAAATGRLSARGLERVRRVALTLADLSGEGRVGEEHVATALSLRADHVLAGGGAAA